MISSTFLKLASRPVPPNWSQTPLCVLRLVQKTGGLFDTDTLENVDALVSVESTEPAMTTIDMSSLLTTDGGSSMANTLQRSISDTSDLSFLNCDLDLDGLMSGSEFSEIFTDLESLISSNVECALDDNASTDIESGKMIQRLKRKHVDSESSSNTTLHRCSAKRVKVSVDEGDYIDVVSTVDQVTSAYDVHMAKYWERRKKNNVASKRSREIRKQKLVDMERQAEELELVNSRLKRRINELERLTRNMKELLIKKLTSRN